MNETLEKLDRRLYQEQRAATKIEREAYDDGHDLHIESTYIKAKRTAINLTMYSYREFGGDRQKALDWAAEQANRMDMMAEAHGGWDTYHGFRRGLRDGYLTIIKALSA